jgi:hypothetical protein
MMFPPNSRYFGVPTATCTTPRGDIIVYLRRRFVPSPGQFTTLVIHTVTEGERLDLIAAQFMGDPLLFWRIADANNAVDPNELLVPGTLLRITLPEGIPGAGNA